MPVPRLSVARPLSETQALLLLRRVTVPGYLDTFAVVVDRKANALVVSDDAEWAERLRDAVTRNLRDALSQRLGSSRVLLRGEHRVADAELTIEFRDSIRPTEWWNSTHDGASFVARAAFRLAQAAHSLHTT